jgi:hypothetical protein
VVEAPLVWAASDLGAPRLEPEARQLSVFFFARCVNHLAAKGRDFCRRASRLPSSQADVISRPARSPEDVTGICLCVREIDPNCTYAARDVVE